MSPTRFGLREEDRCKIDGRRTRAIDRDMKLAAKASTYVQRGSPARRIKENGVAAYLVEAKSYEAMQRRLQLLEGLARGEKAVADGRVVTHARATRRLARWGGGRKLRPET